MPYPERPVAAREFGIKPAKGGGAARGRPLTEFGGNGTNTLLLREGACGGGRGVARARPQP